ncbi:magnesium/cobalt transporter CorA [Leptospira langatensis]|uniref:Magnesium transport protein CorA n=1 Tax=Leptospira langatensis TaxID=2484983 RepID=A0A5F1ZYC6_9LEPT|nr:magnesium/cobalt transporter CorA [Leptospira langatensis]TGK00106.1 magnesium/cobalt transporter CorA [Leptospira langatensis]TGL42740.1 magnesium/cobalt transporter CorA [Leptospira langatensis]
MIRVLSFPLNHGKISNSKAVPKEVDFSFRNNFSLSKTLKKEKVWIDLENPSEEDLLFLSNNCGFHDLAIEDCTNQNQRPKFEDYEDHAFMVLHSFKSEGKQSYAANETHVFFNQRFIVSVHQHKEPLIDFLWHRCASEPNISAKGTDHVLYLLFDLLVDSNFPILDQISDDITDLENQILMNDVRPDFITNILYIKRNLVRMRRVLSPQREVLNLIMRHEDKFLSEKIRFYFRDVYDHLSRLVETIDMDRDLIGNSMDAYFSLLSQRTNDIIKRLTLVSMIFMPLTFLTGFFGMNFTDLPYASRTILAVSLTTILMIPGAMILYFKYKNWFKD